MRTHPSTSRAYWRVPICLPARLRLGNNQSSGRRPRRPSHCVRASLAGSVISNGTGRPVFCWTMVDRWRMTPPWTTSESRSLTRSQPLSFASRAVLNIARSRTNPRDFKCWRIAQMCFGLSGAFAPVIRPAFQGLRGIRKRSGWPMATSHCGGPRSRPYASRDRNASSADLRSRSIAYGGPAGDGSLTDRLFRGEAGLRHGASGGWLSVTPSVGDAD